MFLTSLIFQLSYFKKIYLCSNFKSFEMAIIRSIRAFEVLSVLEFSGFVMILSLKDISKD